MANWPPLAELEPVLLERFSKYVSIGSDDECWNWTGAKDGNGYGHLLVRRGGGKRVEYRSHRLALWFGGCRFGSEWHVLHLCDNPPCCNPAHLRIGTPADNAADRTVRHRMPPYGGAKNPNAVLTADDVALIRRRLATGATAVALAAQFDVAATTISAIRRGQTWK